MTPKNGAVLRALPCEVSERFDERVCFAPSIEAMLDYRQALGFSPKSHEANLRSMDLFYACHYPGAKRLTKEMVLSWLEEQWSGLGGKATAARLLARYLTLVNYSKSFYDTFLNNCF